MWLRSRIRDTAVSVAAFWLSNLCLWTCVKTPNSNSNNLQQEENWRVTSVESSKYPWYISTQSEVSWSWMSSWLDTLENKSKENIFVCLTTDDEDSFTHTDVLESINDPQNTILEQPIDQLFQKFWENKIPHPLYVSWVAKNFRALLWKWVIENTDIHQKLNKRESDITSETNYEVWDTLRFHMIEPSLLSIFSEDLSDQLKEDGFETFYDKDSSDKDTQNLDYYRYNDWIYEDSELDFNWKQSTDFLYDIVVKSIPWWKSALAVYRNWKLFMATYASVWTIWRKTRMWQYEIIWKNPYKRSTKYENSPMPFALNYSWWYYFHQWNVTWTPLSHWCVRLPWVYASVLYSLVKDREHVDVFIDKNLYKSK